MMMALMGPLPGIFAQGVEASGTIKAWPDDLRPYWVQPTPLSIPRVANRQAFFEQKEGAPLALRFLEHAESKVASNLLFPLEAGLLNLDSRPPEVRLARDETHLLLRVRVAADRAGDNQAGVWPAQPGENFYTKDWVMLAAAADSPRNVPQRAFFFDRNGNHLFRQSDGVKPLSTAPKVPDIEVSTAQDAGGWTLRAAIPLSALGNEVRVPETLGLNVARVSVEPGHLPLASSWAGSFFSSIRFPLFSLSALQAGANPILGVSYGRAVWPPQNQEDIKESEILWPRGRQSAQLTLLHGGAPGQSVRVQHEMRAGKTASVLLDREFLLSPGVNVLRWEWNSGDGSDECHEIKVDGALVDRRTLPFLPRLESSLARFVVFPGEYLSLHADVGMLPNPQTDMVFELSVVQDGRELQHWPVGVVTEPEFDLHWSPERAGLAPGNYQVRLTAKRSGSLWAVSQHAWTYAEHPDTPALEQKIPLRNASFGHLPAPYPVRSGIPFPAGRLFDSQRLRLVDEKNREVQAAFHAVGWWPQDGSIKWVHGDFLFNPARKYRIVISEKSREPIKSELQVTETDEQFLVSTGSMTVAFGRNGFDGFHNLHLANGEASPFTSGTPGNFYAVDENQVRYESSPKTGRTEIEEQNSERVTLKFTGRCTNPTDHGEVLRYILRMVFHRGQSWIDVQHTLIVTANTQLVRFREIALDLGIWRGAEELLLPDQPPLALKGDCSILQLDPETRTCVSGEETLSLSSDAPATFRFTSSRSALELNVRDFSEMAPMEIRYSPVRGLSLQVWPDLNAHPAMTPEETPPEDLIRLPFLHRGPFLDFSVPFAYLAKSESRQQEAYMLSGIRMANGMGVSRTHEFQLVFGGKSPAKSYFARAHACADPAWMCATEAVGGLPMDPRQENETHPLVAETEKALDAAFDWEAARLKATTKGKWTWGAMHSQWDDTRQRWTLYRPFRNSHHGSTKGYYYLFARSGDPKYLAFGERASNYINEIGAVHYADSDLEALPYFGKAVGAMCDYKGFVPWHSGSRFDYNSYADNFLSSYYLTGNPRSRDFLEEMHDFLLTVRRRSGGLGRMGASRMETAASLYEFTLDGRLLGYLHRSFQDGRNQQTKEGFIPGGNEFSFWLEYYLNLTRNPEALDVLKKTVTADAQIPWWYDLEGKTWQQNWDQLAYAYRLWSDPKILEQGARRLRDANLNNIYLNPGHPDHGSMAGYNVTWSFLSHKIPSFLWALKRAPELHWKSPRETLVSLNLQAQWTTLAAFRIDERAPLRLRIRGSLPLGKPLQWRVVNSAGLLLKEGTIEKLDWTLLPLANPPVAPVTYTAEVPISEPEEPVFLQVKGVKGPLRFLPPLSNAAKEVYAATAGDCPLVTGSSRDTSPGAGAHWFGYSFGNRPVSFRVPAEGRAISLALLTPVSGPYRYVLKDPEGKPVQTLAGVSSNNPTINKFSTTTLDGVRGRDVTVEVAAHSPVFLEFGADIPPWVSLSPESFFLPGKTGGNTDDSKSGTH